MVKMTLTLEVAKELASWMTEKMIYHAAMSNHKLPEAVAKNIAGNMSIGIVDMCIRAVAADSEPRRGGAAEKALKTRTERLTGGEHE